MTDIQIDSNKEKFKSALKKVSFRFPVSEISESTGYGKSQVSKIINEKIEVSDEFLKKFSEAYNIDLNDSDKPIKELQVSKDIGVPYYDVDFSGGWNSDEIFSEQKPNYYINSPDFEKAEFACNLFGNSISNRILSGSIIGLKKIENWQTYFPTNELYAILLKNDLRTVKIIKREKGTDNLILIPDPLQCHNIIEYENEIVPIDFVTSFFQVVAWGKFERLSM